MNAIIAVEFSEINFSLSNFNTELNILNKLRGNNELYIMYKIVYNTSIYTVCIVIYDYE